MQSEWQQAGSGVWTVLFFPVVPVNAAGVFGVPLKSVCVVKLRKISPHHLMSQPLLSSSPDFPL